MKLSRKNIGQLFDCGGDGSWVYQLVAVNKCWLLFYNFHSGYYKEHIGKHSDWQRFRPRPWPKEWVERGWNEAKEK